MLVPLHLQPPTIFLTKEPFFMVLIRLRENLFPAGETLFIKVFNKYQNWFLLTCVISSAFLSLKPNLKAYSKPSRKFKMKLFGKRLETVAYFCKKLHLRCSTGFWPRLWNPSLSKCLIHPIKSTIFPPITIIAVICINGARSSQEINPSGNTFHYWQYEGVQTFIKTI